MGLTLAVASGGYSLIAVHWLLTVVASLVVENELQGMSASVVVGTWAQWLQLPGLEHRLNSGLSCSTARGIFLDQGSNP